MWIVTIRTGNGELGHKASLVQSDLKIPPTHPVELASLFLVGNGSIISLWDSNPVVLGDDCRILVVVRRQNYISPYEH